VYEDSIVRRPKTMIRIEEARDGDLSSIVRVERASFPNPWSEESILSFVSQPDRRACLVARDQKPGDGVIGYTALQFAADEAEICNLAVLPSLRGKGIGALLIQSAVELCVRNSVSVLHLEVRRGNVPAIRLYEKQGFRRVGIRRGYYGDGKEDALLYALRIGS